MVSKIKELISEGRFNTAINLCEEEIRKNENNLDERIHFEEEKKLIEKYYEAFITNIPGETFLPLVNQNNNQGKVLKLKTAYGSYDDINVNEKWTNNIKEIITDFFDLYFKKEYPFIKIFEWDLSELKCGIKNYYNSVNKYEIEGKSYLLPLILSVISLLTEKDISNEYCFTGDLEKFNNKYVLKRVEGIEIKQKVIQEELPVVRKFIYPETSKDLFDIVKELFGDSVKNIIKSPFVKRSIVLEKREVGSEFGKHKVITISLNGNILIDEFSQMPEFLRNNIHLLKDEGNGVIYDGRAPIAIYSMITSITEIINSLPNFLAINYPSAIQPNNSSYKAAIVIRTSNSGGSKLKEGDVIYYK